MLIERMSASSLDDDALAGLFNRGYAGYFAPVHLNAEQLSGMIALQDLDRADSCVLRVDGDLAAFSLLGVRGRRGWIGGMGVAPEHRGRGLGRLAMEAALERAHARGLEHVDLEVLFQNRPAHRIYRALGFRERRTLEVWERPASTGAPDKPTPATALDPAAWRQAVASLTGATAPWQRDRAVLDRLGASLRGFVAADANGAAAGVLARPESSRTSLLELVTRPGAPDSARRSVVAAALSASPGSPGFALNLPEADPFGAALLALGFGVTHRQHEMTRALAT